MTATLTREKRKPARAVSYPNPVERGVLFLDKNLPGTCTHATDAVSHGGQEIAEAKLPVFDTISPQHWRRAVNRIQPLYTEWQLQFDPNDNVVIVTAKKH